MCSVTFLNYILTYGEFSNDSDNLWNNPFAGRYRFTNLLVMPNVFDVDLYEIESSV